MKIWIDNGEVIKIYEVEDLGEAHERITATAGCVDWDIVSFRAPPRPAEEVEQFKYVQF
jgi:hypothetical protein